jgi:hypothetical protein
VGITESSAETGTPGAGSRHLSAADPSQRQTGMRTDCLNLGAPTICRSPTAAPSRTLREVWARLASALVAVQNHVSESLVFKGHDDLPAKDFTQTVVTDVHRSRQRRQNDPLLEHFPANDERTPTLAQGSHGTGNFDVPYRLTPQHFLGPAELHSHHHIVLVRADPERMTTPVRVANVKDDR